MTRGSRRGRTATRARPTVRARQIAVESVRVTGDLLGPAAPEDTEPTAPRRRRVWARLRGQEPIPGLGTIKVAIATTLAFLLATGLPGTELPVVAALTALLVVQVTPIQSIRSGWRRIFSVVAGVLIAVLFSTLFGLTWWSLGVTVVAAMTVAHLLRLGDQALEVPISAMLVLAVAGSADVGMERVFETFIGAGVGVLVSIILPRVYVQPAGDQIGMLAAEVGRQLHDVSNWVEHDWTRQNASEANRRARELENLVNSARQALATAEESVRLNPRALRTAHLPSTMRPGLTALEFCTISMRGLTRALLDRVSGPGADRPPGPRIRSTLSRLTGNLGDAITAFGVVVASDIAAPPPSADELRTALDRSRECRDEASRELLEDAGNEPAVWRVNGAFLGHVDRFIADLDPDTENVSPAITRPRPSTPQRPLTRLSNSLLRRPGRSGHLRHGRT